MHDQSAARNIQNPVLHNPSAGVKRTVDVEIVIQRAVGNFNQQTNVLGLRIAGRKLRPIPIQYQQVRNRLINRVLCRMNVNWCLGIHERMTKNLLKSDQNKHCGIDMRTVFPHLADQFPVH